MKILALAAMALAVGCSPTATVETTDAGCKASLNRGWFTEQKISGYRATCDPSTGRVTLRVDEQEQATQTEALAAVAEAAAKGAAKGVVPGP
jgi:hypothetical protein